MTLQQGIANKKKALRAMAATLGYKLAIEADDSGSLEYWLSGGEAFSGDRFHAGMDVYDALETLEVYASSHPVYSEALHAFTLATQEAAR
jgi:hypothetical protein